MNENDKSDNHNDDNDDNNDDYEKQNLMQPIEDEARRKSHNSEHD